MMFKARRLCIERNAGVRVTGPVWVWVALNEETSDQPRHFALRKRAGVADALEIIEKSQLTIIRPPACRRDRFERTVTVTDHHALETRRETAGNQHGLSGPVGRGPADEQGVAVRDDRLLVGDQAADIAANTVNARAMEKADLTGDLLW